MILTILPSVFFIVLSLLSVSLFMSAALAIYAFRMKDSKAAFLFGIIMILVVLWSALKVSCMFIYSVGIREILHNINILLVLPIPPIFLLLSVYYTKFPKWFKFRHIILLFIIPFVLTTMVITSPLHNFIFYDFVVRMEYSIPMHYYKMNFGYFLFDFYIYGVMIISLLILFRSINNRDLYFRRQMLLFMIGGFIPLAYDVLFTLGISPLKNYNMACVFISIGNVFFAWSLFGYRFFKLVPITRNVVVENMADIMIVVNEENLIIDINRSGKTFFGIRKENVVGNSFFEIFKNYPDLIRKYLNYGDNINEIIIERDNKPCYFSISISNVAGGAPFLAKIIILHDVSARIKSEIKIKQLSIAVEQSPVSIITTDLNGNIEYINHAFCETTGYSEKESIGRHTRFLKGKTTPEVYTELWSRILSGNIWRGEFINKKKNGEFYYTETVIAPIKNIRNQSINFIAIMNDITERKMAEMKIKIQNDELIELNATKDKFFSIIAHDLKNPFNSIMGLSYLLVNHFDKYDSDKIKTILQNIEATANHTYKLLENLLEWARIHQGKITPNLKKHNLSQIFSEIQKSQMISADDKKISIKSLIDMGILVNCDAEMTKTVLRNLISNAVKFTNRNGKITVTAEAEDGLVKISIADNGIGIDKDRINSLFRIDRNISTPGTEDERGSGLGLILCREMVEKQGGKISIESEPGNGSIIQFTLKEYRV